MCEVRGGVNDKDRFVIEPQDRRISRIKGTAAMALRRDFAGPGRRTQEQEEEDERSPRGGRQRRASARRTAADKVHPEKAGQRKFVQIEFVPPAENGEKGRERADARTDPGVDPQGT